MTQGLEEALATMKLGSIRTAEAERMTYAGRDDFGISKTWALSGVQWCQVIVSDVKWCQVMLSDVKWCEVMLRDVESC